MLPHPSQDEAYQKNTQSPLIDRENKMRVPSQAVKNTETSSLLSMVNNIHLLEKNLCLILTSLDNQMLQTLDPTEAVRQKVLTGTRDNSPVKEEVPGICPSRSIIKLTGKQYLLREMKMRISTSLL